MANRHVEKIKIFMIDHIKINLATFICFELNLVVIYKIQKMFDIKINMIQTKIT